MINELNELLITILNNPAILLGEVIGLVIYIICYGVYVTYTIPKKMNESYERGKVMGKLTSELEMLKTQEQREEALWDYINKKKENEK